ncbi:MAG: zinc metallopeptidase [Clostridiaceae bacterium]|nr:zinc metallopeptidase [Clostridiaceae bacterium]
MYWDPTYILVIIGALLSMAASANIQRTYAKWRKVPTQQGITGAEVAAQILRRNQVTNVQIVRNHGHLTDNFDPRNMQLNLSENVHDSTSVAALGVAAHEVGHALQKKTSYGPLKLRTLMVPAVNIGSWISVPLILVGLLIQSNAGVLIMNIGMIAFGLTAVFTLITLPVEFDASRRAIAALREEEVMSEDELVGARKVLNAAALTYVASATAAILSLLRIYLLIQRRRD